MVSIPQLHRTVHLEAKFGSAYLGKKGLMRILTQTADCGYSMNNDGAIPLGVFIWQRGRGNIQNTYNQCLLA